MLSALAYRMLRDHVHLWITFVFVSINTCVSLGITKTSPEDHVMLLAFQRVLKGGGGGGRGPNPISHLKFWQLIPVPVGFLSEIPVRVIEIPVSKKTLFIDRINSFKTF
jgi:hypothetical protein